MRFLGHDIRAAARRLWQSPVYLAFSVLTLAVAIGSTTAVYSVIEAALFRQQPFPRIGEIVNIYQSDVRFGASGPMIYLSHHDLEDLQASQTTFASVAAWRRFVGVAVSDVGSQQLLGEAVTGEYFDLLGVNAALGRVLQPADDQPQAPPVIVLSDGVWRRMFGADPLVVGKSLRLGGTLFEIVGVAPAWFRGSDMPNLIPTPAWIPAASTRHFSETGLAVHDLDKDARAWMLKARLKPGATVDSARAEVAAISQRIVTADPARRFQRNPAAGPDPRPNTWFVLPLVDLRLHESMHQVAGPVASMLMGAVILVLLVGCSNLANLTLARVARRQQEVAVRVALGASRLRIVREQLVESSIIAALGWGLGLLLARGLMNIFGQSIEMHAAVSITLQLQPALNVPVLAASLAATALSVVVVGLGPAIRQSRGDVRSAIASEGAGPVAPRWRGRATLVTGQVAVSVLLLSLSAVFLRELRVSLEHDPGFDLAHLAVMQLDFADNKYEASRTTQELSALREMVGRTNGVASAAVMSAMPIGTERYANAQATAEEASLVQSGFVAPQNYARWMAVDGPALDTLGVRLLEGRAIDERDRRDGPAVAVISATLAGRLFPNGHALGQQFFVKHSDASGPGTPTALTVIGIASNTDTDTFGAKQGPGWGRSSGLSIYVPLSQHAATAVSVVARSTGDPSALVAILRQSMKRVDPAVPVLTADTGYSIAGPAVLVLQVISGIAGSLGAFALVLAISGLYGVLSDLVARRTREIGIRLALGAERRVILRLVVLDGLRPVLFGILLGLPFAVVLSRLLPFPIRLSSASVAGPFALAALPLIVAGVIACVIPARRASRVDPNVALRNL